MYVKSGHRKAFDTVSWSFILDLLKLFGFPLIMINWIKECITTASFSIFLNGKMHGFLKSQRGLRQGNPISPYLFVLAMEYLSISIKAATANPDFNFHPKCKNIGLTHLSFTDDIIFFSRGDTQSVSLLFDSINQFSKCSGLELNLSKSHTFAAGIEESAFQEISQLTGFAAGSFLVIYLGSPLVHGKLKSYHFNPIIERITNFINVWSSHNLSYAGRLELIKEVIQGVESFWIQNFPITVIITDKISRLCRNFLWGGTKPKVAWMDICSPKSEGGLGLRDCKIWNKAMLLRILWDIHSHKNSLWIKWVHAFYLRGKDIWLWQNGKADHPLFKNILQLRNALIAAGGSVHQAKQLLSSWFTRGRFCTAMAYDWLRVKNDKKPWMFVVWKRYIPPKLSFILWLALRGRLNTKDRWLLSNMDNNCCVFCKRFPESVAHLFFKCSFVNSIWRKIRFWLNIQRPMSTLHNTVKWIKKDFGGALLRSKTMTLAFAATVYTIWSARNKFLFAGLPPSPNEIVYNIKSLVFFVLQALYPSDLLLF